VFHIRILQQRIPQPNELLTRHTTARPK
jgi:hypothetical protein